MYYPKLDDAMSKLLIECRIPESYLPRLPGIYKKHPDMLPLYTDNQPFSYAKLAIEYIVDLCCKNVTFIIVNPADVIMVVDLLEQYTAELTKGTEFITDETDPRVIYLSKCRIALNLLKGDSNRAKEQQQVHDNLERPPGLEAILSLIQW